MALVSYDYNSGSDDEITDEEETTNSRVIITSAQTSSTVALAPKETENEISKNPGSPAGLFSHLPQAKSSSSQISEDSDQLEDFIPTVKTLKEKKKIQITIPSLSDFDEPCSQEPALKRVKPSQQGSGLLGMLPPVQTAPKSNIMFVPNTLRKPNNSTKSTTTRGSAVISKPVSNNKQSPSTTKSKTGSDSDSDIEDVPIPDTFDDQMWEKVCGRSKPVKPTVEVNMTAQEETQMEYTSAPEAVKPYDGLDNTAFKELVGKTKRPLGNIKLIDINEDEILPDKDLWMTKSLTDPDMAPRPDSQDDVDPTKKRKHHITYLAQQAKANEQELKSAWAAGRNNRMMSRSKYGF